eukprot:TRINITY_DN56145_c0_g1_i1.p1 TRINITY_DN56145_c0_g1~~TRINITY_DN56145_c0_g1_i1.p1  ORF type:complete len:369 (+),score=53.40 TRINITY_DN56145_c0_g1_i1:54-1109(+)
MAPITQARSPRSPKPGGTQKSLYAHTVPRQSVVMRSNVPPEAARINAAAGVRRTGPGTPCRRITREKVPGSSGAQELQSSSAFQAVGVDAMEGDLVSSAPAWLPQQISVARGRPGDAAASSQASTRSSTPSGPGSAASTRHTRSSSSVHSLDSATAAQSFKHSLGAAHTPGLKEVELRLQNAERAILEKDEQIKALSEQLRDVAQKHSTSSEEYATAADIDCVHAKSQLLLNKMLALDDVDDPACQWRSLMASLEDYKDRVAKIEAMVTKRVEQRPTGDGEMRLCRSIRGICLGAQRSTPRRWVLTGSQAPSTIGASPSKLSPTRTDVECFTPREMSACNAADAEYQGAPL